MQAETYMKITKFVSRHTEDSVEHILSHIRNPGWVSISFFLLGALYRT